jgi:hypothetical protein
MEYQAIRGMRRVLLSFFERYPNRSHDTGGYDSGPLRHPWPLAVMRFYMTVQLCQYVYRPFVHARQHSLNFVIIHSLPPFYSDWTVHELNPPLGVSAHAYDVPASEYDVE